MLQKGYTHAQPCNMQNVYVNLKCGLFYEIRLQPTPRDYLRNVIDGRIVCTIVTDDQYINKLMDRRLCSFGVI